MTREELLKHNGKHVQVKIGNDDKQWAQLECFGDSEIRLFYGVHVESSELDQIRSYKLTDADIESMSPNGPNNLFSLVSIPLDPV